MTYSESENRSVLTHATEAGKKLQLSPVHNVTPGQPFEHRYIVVHRVGHDWHIGLVERDEYVLLRHLVRSPRNVASQNADRFKAHYGAISVTFDV